MLLSIDVAQIGLAHNEVRHWILLIEGMIVPMEENQVVWSVRQVHRGVDKEPLVLAEGCDTPGVALDLALEALHTVRKGLGWPTDLTLTEELDKRLYP